MAHENVIEMRDITKVFGEFVANDNINLHLRKSEIHALFRTKMGLVSPRS